MGKPGEKTKKSGPDDILVPVPLSKNMKAFLPLKEVEDRRILDVAFGENIDEDDPRRRQIGRFRDKAGVSDYFISPLSPMQVHIIRLLNEHGVIASGLVKHPQMKRGANLSDRVYLMENIGYSLMQMEVPKNQRKKVADGLTHAIGTMHSLGIKHGDIDPINVLFNDKYEVGLIDFEFSAKKKVNWGDFDKVFRFFSDDVYYYKQLLERELGYSKAKMGEYVGRLVDHYPMKPKDKTCLTDRFIQMTVEEALPD